MDYEPTWQNFTEANRRLGLCIGALKGLSATVSDELKPNIESVIAEAEYGKAVKEDESFAKFFAHTEGKSTEELDAMIAGA